MKTRRHRHASTNERFLHGLMPAGELGWFMAVLMMLFAQFSEAETAVNNGVVPVSVEQEKAKPEKPTPGQALQPDTPKLELRLVEGRTVHELDGQPVAAAELKERLAGRDQIHFRVVGSVPFPEVHPYFLALVEAGVSPLLDAELPDPAAAPEVSATAP